MSKHAIVSLGLLHFFYSTNADMKDYLKLYMMPRAKDSEIDGLLVHYPDDQRAGSPFDTGIRNALSMISSYRCGGS